jgi:predicted ATPase
LPALGRLIARAAERSQVLVVTHAAKLIQALEEQKDCNSLTLQKEFGETKIVDEDRLDMPVWNWPHR